MRKLPMPNSLDLDRVDPGWPVDVSILIDIYPEYRFHHQWPESGGKLDQDTHIVEAFALLDAQVEWNKQNETKRSNLPTLEDVYSKRRKHHRGE